MYPVAFDFHAPRPLAIGVHRDIAAALAGLSHGTVSRLMKRWTGRANYLSAMAAPGSRQFNLDGTDAGEVTEEHREIEATRLAEKSAVTLEPDTPAAFAAASRNSTHATEKGGAMPKIAATARKLKVTTVLDAAAFADLRLSDNAQARAELTVNVNGRKFRADVATKSVRRVLANIAEHGADGVVVLIQGTLGANDEITEAGLVAQVKQRAEAA